MSNQQSTLVIVALAAIPASMIGFVIGVVILFGGGAGGVIAACQSSSSVDTAGEPALVQYYINAANRFHLGADGYAYLAGINEIETQFGALMATSSAGAVGWMQFEPSTWAEYAVSVTHPGQTADPDDPQDAIFTAAHYLRSSGAPDAWGKAIYNYNHAGWYVSEVQAAAASFIGTSGLSNLRAAIAKAWQGKTSITYATATSEPVSDDGYGADCSDLTAAGSTVAPVPGNVAVLMANGTARPPANAPAAVQAMVSAADRIDTYPYSWGGGHCVSAMNQSSVDLADCPGSEENGGAGFDCSGSSSYVLWAGGLGSSVLDGSPETSGAMASEGLAGRGRWVTWIASGDHVFVNVAGLFFNTENSVWFGSKPEPSIAGTDTGPRWSTANALDTFTRAGFVDRHAKGL